MSQDELALAAPAAVPAWRRLLDGLRRRAGSPQAGLALHVFKVVLAALLSLLVSMALDMGSPRTAIFTVFLVMQQRSGLVFQKSYYRLLGTFVGALVSIALIGAFVQTPEVFLAVFALWVAACTAGSFVFRNFQSYGFVLAGYTVCFVALPAVDAPGQVFDLAVNRLLEMFIGVACAAVVSDILFPQRMSDLVHGALARRFANLLAVLRELPAHGKDKRQAAMLGFVGDALGLEAVRVNAALESSDLRRRRQHLALLNHEFMGLSTTLHSVLSMRQRLHDNGHAAVAAALGGLQASFSSTLAGSQATCEVLPRLEAWRESYTQRVQAVRAGLPPALEAGDRLDFETGVELLGRLADEFRAYCATQASLQAGDDLAVREAVTEQGSLRFTTRSDPLLVGLAALRGMAVTLVAGSLWLASGWTWGAGAMTTAVAPGTLFAALPNPVRVIRHFLLGLAIALPVGLVWNFWLIPQASDWVGLTLILIPPLVFAAWLSSNPPTAGIGAGFYICFMLHSNLDRSFNLQLTDFVEGHLADICGTALAGMFYILLDPNLGGWRQRRTVRALRRQLVAICDGSGTRRREELESASRDLVQSIATRGQLADAADRWVFDWLLAVLEVGRAAIDLREAMAESEPDAVPMSVSFALHRLAELFADPTAERRAAALAAVGDAIAVLSPAGADAVPPRLPARRRQAMVLDLHFIRSALLEPPARPAARN